MPLSCLLLDMVCAGLRDGDRVADGRLRELTPDDWQHVARMAAQHRLEPILNAALADCAVIPQEVRDGWRAASRMWSIRAVAARADLTEAVALLDRAGFAPLALKGAFLAWHAYPAPALRPLRDIDILVPAAVVHEAFALLAANGFAPCAMAPGADDARGKHLTPMIARCGTVIELHHRLWEANGALDHGSPHADADRVRARSITVDGVAFPCPEDMLAHLVIHAVYSHRLDCGPLLLWDIAQLTARWPVDWSSLRNRASDERWGPGLDLIIALLRRHAGLAGITDAAAAPGGDAPPVAMIDAAADLLLQDLDTRRSAGLAATALVHGVHGVASRVVRGAGARLRPGRPKAAGEPEIRLVDTGIGGWAKSRLRRTIGELAEPAVRDQARDLGRLSRWLGS